VDPGPRSRREGSRGGRRFDGPPEKGGFHKWVDHVANFNLETSNAPMFDGLYRLCLIKLGFIIECTTLPKLRSQFEKKSSASSKRGRFQLWDSTSQGLGIHPATHRAKQNHGNMICQANDFFPWGYESQD